MPQPRSSRIPFGLRQLLRVALAWTVGTSATAVDAYRWPDDEDWKPLRCGLAPAFDPRGDTPGADGPQDVVGDADAPALYVHADDASFYVRMRVDGDPVHRHELQPFGWGLELDADLDRRAYELISMVDGVREPQEMRLSTNTRQERLDHPADLPERALTRFPFHTHARISPAAGAYASRFGDDPDYFVDWAIPLDAITSQGVTRASVLSFVVGTSSNGESIDADVACHDGSSSSARWSRAATDAVGLDGEAAEDADEDGLSDAEEAMLGTAPDRRDSDGDGSHDGEEVRAGTNPHDAAARADLPTVDELDERASEGGGCTLAPRAAGSGAAWVAGIALVLALRRRRR